MVGAVGNGGNREAPNRSVLVVEVPRGLGDDCAEEVVVHGVESTDGRRDCPPRRPAADGTIYERSFVRRAVRSWSSIAEFEAFLDEGGIVEAVDDMPEEYRRRVFGFIEMHANSELMGGLTERDFIPRAPGMVRKLGTLAKTQDEIGHAHLLYMVAADLGIKTRDEMLADLFAGRTKFHNVFHYRVHTWADQVAIAY
ncbi:MAG: hypothetical protein GWO04_23280, partial [Actinobacteria bacterium]|nr:hypothetical protein [Actinomycetota bacterium]NIV56566.1 hypothetical protein [Actinomycetota bacterium]